MVKLKNKDNLEIVESFIRIYGKVIEEMFPDDDKNIEIYSLHDEDNEYHDIMARLGDKIYISKRECGQIGFTDIEIMAALAHELGHVLLHTDPFLPDAETRADGLAADIGLGTQMISVIEKIIYSRRYRNITSDLVHRIHNLQHIA